jgi:hypothetical protein
MIVSVLSLSAVFLCRGSIFHEHMGGATATAGQQTTRGPRRTRTLISGPQVCSQFGGVPRVARGVVRGVDQVVESVLPYASMPSRKTAVAAIEERHPIKYRGTGGLFR